MRTHQGPEADWGPAGVRALLLAAGRGERLRPLTDLVPKPALPMPGAPLGAWMLEGLLRRFDSVTVNCSHLASAVISQLALEDRVEVLREEPEPLGTGGTLAAIRSRVEDRIVVANADVICDLDLDALLDAHARMGAGATVAVKRVESGADFGLTAEARVAGFFDRRFVPYASGARFIGVAVYERAALDRLSDEVPLGLGEALLAPLASEGDLATYMHDGYVTDVGTLQRYVDACGDVLAEVAPRSPAGPYQVYEGEFVDVEGGRAFIARSAACERAGLGPGAVILGGARVGMGTKVADSIVWSNEEVPPGTLLRNSLWFRGRSLTLK
jgi:mannose-1-phosphate guanylyltransferase